MPKSGNFKNEDRSKNRINFFIESYNDFVHDMTKTNRDPSAEAKIKLSSYLFLSFLRSSLSNVNQMCFLTEVTRLREVCRASTTPVSESVIVTEESVSLLQAPIYGHGLPS